MDKIDIDSNDAKSEDVVAENVRRLGELFPELMTEGPSGPSINVDVLKQLVGDASVSEVDEKYGLSWFGKRNARKMALTPSLGTLLPCPDESEDWDSTKNLMIEGDNLEVLKLLQKSYSGKVKLIYIDPPYNTGKDFVYPDNYQDNIKNYLELTGQSEEGRKTTSNAESSGRFHTDWLNMMYPRLKLAQSLLSENGLIFISIDDNEQDHLRKVCDEVFGASNFLCQFVWKKGGTGKNDSQFAVVEHEYVVSYARNSNFAEFNLDDEGSVTTSYNLEDQQGKYSLVRLDMQNLQYSKSLDYDLVGPDGQIYKLNHKNPSQPNAIWRWSKDRVQREMDRLVFKAGNVYTKNYAKDGTKVRTLLADDRFGVTRTGGAEAELVIGSPGIFDFPKPVRLLRFLARIATNDEDITLDFFAGSGTTGQAVMEQNALDGGNRQFILVQLPEPLLDQNKEQASALAFCRERKLEENIAALTAERLRRAGAKVRSENPMFAGDVGFRVFKLAESNIRAWDPLAEDLEGTLRTSEDHLVAGRSELDVLYEILLKRGLDLCVPIETKSIAGHHVSAVGGGVMFACLGSKISQSDVEALAEGIVAWRVELGVAGDVNCIFRDSAFDGDVAKSNMSSVLEQAGFTRIQSL